MDVMGRTVHIREVGQDETMVDVRTLMPGCYVLQIVLNGEISSVRIMVESSFSFYRL